MIAVTTREFICDVCGWKGENPFDNDQHHLCPKCGYKVGSDD